MAGIFGKLFGTAPASPPSPPALRTPDQKAREWHEKLPFLLGMQNAFSLPIITHGPTGTSYRYHRQDINNGEAVYRVLLRLLDGACFARNKRGYDIADATGKIISPEVWPELGIVIERTPLADGREKVLLAYDVGTIDVDPPLPRSARRPYNGPREDYLWGGSPARWKEAHDLGVVDFESAYWASQCFSWEVDKQHGGWTTPRDLRKAPSPLLMPLLREVVTGDANANPLAPESTEKGDAQFGWPDEWT